MSDIKSQKVLKGRKEIAAAINISEPTIDILIKIGLPVVRINGTLYSHIDVIDQYFEHICTRHRGKVFKLDAGTEAEFEGETNPAYWDST